MGSRDQDIFVSARVGGRIGPLDLPVPDGPPVRLRRGGRSATVLIRVPRDASPEVRAWLAEVDGARASLAQWDGRVVVVVAGGVDDARKLAAATGILLPVTAHPSGAPPTDAEDVAIVVIDRWGEVYHVIRAATAHDLPSPHGLEEWFRFLGTQCPECGVPDSADLGEWGG